MFCGSFETDFKYRGNDRGRILDVELINGFFLAKYTGKEVVECKGSQ